MKLVVIIVSVLATALVVAFLVVQTNDMSPSSLGPPMEVPRKKEKAQLGLAEPYSQEPARHVPRNETIPIDNSPTSIEAPNARPEQKYGGANLEELQEALEMVRRRYFMESNRVLNDKMARDDCIDLGPFPQGTTFRVRDYLRIEDDEPHMIRHKPVGDGMEQIVSVAVLQSNESDEVFLAVRDEYLWLNQRIDFLLGKYPSPRKTASDTKPARSR